MVRHFKDARPKGNTLSEEAFFGGDANVTGKEGGTRRAVETDDQGILITLPGTTTLWRWRENVQGHVIKDNRRSRTVNRSVGDPS
jgi:surface antigen